MNNFIYENSYSLSYELCKEIIEKFENDDTKLPGEVMSGYYPDIKKTTDLNISNCNNWNFIHTVLYKELMHNINIYKKNINNMYEYCNINQNTKELYKILNDYIDIPSIIIKKYQIHTGRYVYHNDFHVNYLNGKYRVLTFLWYLNDIENGGETDFFSGQIVIKPKMGKLIIFPACWTFPHSGKIPHSDNKYIVTGWIYSH